MDYKSLHTVEQRLEEATKIMEKYPNRVPVIVEIDKNQVSKGALPAIDKNKFLVPTDLTVGQFMLVIRKRMKVDSTSGLIIFAGNSIISTSMLFSQVYEEYKNPDKFLYLIISKESVFG